MKKNALAELNSFSTKKKSVQGIQVHQDITAIENLTFVGPRQDN